MEFASDFVYDIPDVEYEQISDEEFERGMSVSESGSSDEEDAALEVRAAGGSRGRGGSRQAQASPKKKMRLKKKSKPSHHWKGSAQAEYAEPQPRSLAQAAPAAARSGKRWFRRADTNVVSVNFNTLLSPGNMHAGEPVVCQKCGAILSHISKAEVQGEQKMWTCEFCGELNDVDVEDEEIPKSEDVTYLVQPAMTTSHSSMSGVDQSLVIFCVDTSGSMCVTSEINGKVKLRGTAQLKRLESFNDTREDQWLPSQRTRDVTYVSRLQAMQAAVDHQLGDMVKTFPHRRVALITFSNEVCVLGDGTQTEVTIAGDKLSNKEQLKKEGTELTLPQSVKDSQKVLGDKVYKLEEGGATALGPALVVAVSMASHHPGSKVIVCTDGKANIGLGKMEEPQDEATAEQFYTGVGEQAVNAGVTISVVTIEGTDCKLVHLGKLADKTGGQVNIVDPLKLREEFSNVLADPIIATKVKATFILYKDLYVYKEDEPDNQPCRAEEQVGNVTSESVITFQFARRQKTDKGEQEKKTADSAVVPMEVEQAGDQAAAGAVASAEGASGSSKGAEKARSDLPFQLQIEYVDTEGNQALRVITRSMPVTAERRTAEMRANLDVLGIHAAKKSADMALKGQYTNSRGIALMNQRLAWRHSKEAGDRKEAKGKYKNIFGKLKHMENMLQQQQQAEIVTRGRTHSDDEDEDVDEGDACYMQSAITTDGNQPEEEVKRSKGFIAKKFRRMHADRSREMADRMANMVYQFRSVGKDISSSEPIGTKQHSAVASANKEDESAHSTSE